MAGIARAALAAVQMLLHSGRSVRAVAEGLGISDATLKKWKERRLSQNSGQDLLSRQLELENQRLRRELQRVTLQRDILKKSLGILFEEPPPKDMPL